MYEAGQIERLAKDEKAAKERVAHFQLGVFGLLDDELLLAEIAESAAAVGHPSRRRHGGAVSAGCGVNASNNLAVPQSYVPALTGLCVCPFFMHLPSKANSMAIVQRFFDFIKSGFIFCYKSIKFDLKPNTKTNFLFLRHGKTESNLNRIPRTCNPPPLRPLRCRTPAEPCRGGHCGNGMVEK